MLVPPHESSHRCRLGAVAWVGTTCVRWWWWWWWLLAVVCIYVARLASFLFLRAEAFFAVPFSFSCYKGFAVFYAVPRFAYFCLFFSVVC